MPIAGHSDAARAVGAAISLVGFRTSESPSPEFQAELKAPSEAVQASAAK